MRLKLLPDCSAVGCWHREFQHGEGTKRLYFIEVDRVDGLLGLGLGSSSQAILQIHGNLKRAL